MNIKEMLMIALFTMLVMALMKELATKNNWGWYPEFFEEGDDAIPSIKPSVKAAEGDESTPAVLSAYDQTKINIDAGCGDKNLFLSSHLLPKDEQIDESFSEFAPNTDDISTLNFLQADRLTASSGSTRNANLQLRSEPPNPRNVVCAWQQTTISPEDASMRKNFEIGAQMF